jgi:hypothetical protein
MVKNESETREEIDRLKCRLLEDDNLLRQYALWLEAGEEVTIFKGKDVMDMLKGTMYGHGASLGFIPGVGWENLVRVLSDVQRESGLDLGICKYLCEEKGDNYPTCLASDNNVLIGSLNQCFPPARVDCMYRIQRIAEEKNK